MATLNAVDNRMEFGRFCDDDLLSCFNFGERGLIVCDVEGYERDLFTLAAKKNLGRCDILIEFHDFIGRSITDGIMQVLDESHTCQLIDMKPRTPGKYAMLKDVSYKDQQVALNERWHRQQWGFFQPK